MLVKELVADVRSDDEGDGEGEEEEEGGEGGKWERVE